MIDFRHFSVCSAPPVVGIVPFSFDSIGVVLKLDEETTVVVRVDTSIASARVVVSTCVFSSGARRVRTWSTSQQT